MLQGGGNKFKDLKGCYLPLFPPRGALPVWLVSGELQDGKSSSRIDADLKIAQLLVEESVTSGCCN